MPSDDDWLDDIDDSDLDIDDLVEQITVDAYGNEGYTSFCQAFEDNLDLPISATVIGTDVTITRIDFDGDERRGLTTTARRDSRTWTVSLLDVEVPESEHRFLRLTDAYRRWLGKDHRNDP